MSLIEKLLKADVRDLFPFVPSTQPARAPSQPARDDTYQQFSRVAESGRIIRAYSGILPGSRRTARHLLRCEHLRDIPGEGFSPFRAEPHHTHQIWLWYRLSKEPDKLILLFRGQFCFTLAGTDADWVAGEVADFLAYLLLSDAQNPWSEVFRHDNSDLFWALAVEKKVENLRSNLKASK